MSVEGEEWLDVLGSGGILKKIVKAGNGNRPDFGQEVFIKYEEKVDSTGAITSSCGDDDLFSFRVGENDVISAWDIGIRLMEEGEQCIFKVESKFAYGALPDPSGKVLANSDMVYDVTLVKLGEMSPDLGTIDPESRVKLATKKKERGNALFKSKRLEEAFKSYNFAIKLLETRLSDEDKENMKENGILTLLVICHNNICQVQLSTGNYTEAKKSAEKVLSLDENNIKGLSRMASVHMHNKDHLKAQKLYQLMLTLEPKNVIANKQLKVVAGLLNQDKEKEKEMYKKMMEQKQAKPTTQSQPQQPPPKPQNVSFSFQMEEKDMSSEKILKEVDSSAQDKYLYIAIFILAIALLLKIGNKYLEF